MAAAGLLTSWAAVLFAAWAFVGALAAEAPAHPVRRSAERALLASAVAAAGATAALLALLLAGDVTISHVARSIARNVPAPYRLAAIFSLPAGAVLPTAALVAIAGAIAGARARSSLGVAAAGAIVMALCAASLAAAPFATLPWVPTEGLGLAPALQHPWSVVGHAALSVSIALAAALVVGAADQVADPPTAPTAVLAPSLLTTATLAVMTIAAWATARGSYAAGIGSTPVPLVAWGGAVVPALAATLMVRQVQPVGGASALLASLGALGLMCVVLLGARLHGTGSAAVATFAILSLGAATSGAVLATHRARVGAARLLTQASIVTFGGGAAAALWLAGGALQWMGTAAQWLLIVGGVAMALADALSSPGEGRGAVWGGVAGGGAGLALGLWLAPPGAPATGWLLLAGLVVGATALRLTDPGSPSTARLARTLLTIAAASAAFAAAGEGRTLTSTLSLASGGRGDVAVRFGSPVSLAHQGVSRYQDRNAHAIAVALEPWRHGRPLPLQSVEQREYVDSRDETLGPAVTRPAMLGLPLEEVRVSLAGVSADEEVRLTVSVVPFAAGWTVALACVILAALLLAVARLAPLPPSSPAEQPLA